MPPKRSRATMRPDVGAAVQDILHGTNVDSHTEWLQREYIRLMRREAQWKQREYESKLKQNAEAGGDGVSVANRSAEQHSAKEHSVGVDVDTQSHD